MVSFSVNIAIPNSMITRPKRARRRVPYSVRGEKRTKANTPYKVNERAIPSKHAIPASTPLRTLFSTLAT